MDQPDLLQQQLEKLSVEIRDQVKKDLPSLVAKNEYHRKRFHTLTHRSAEMLIGLVAKSVIEHVEPEKLISMTCGFLVSIAGFGYESAIKDQEDLKKT